MTKLLNELAAKHSRCSECGASAEYLKSDGKTIAGVWYSFTCIKCGAQCRLSKFDEAVRDCIPDSQAPADRGGVDKP